jgi:hypothetical protein
MLTRYEYLSKQNSFLQKTVDANVNFNAREGRSTVEVCKKLNFQLMFWVQIYVRKLEQSLPLSSSHYELSTVSELQVSDSTGKGPAGKQALTRFQRICTDGVHSIVLCKPVTGRTHQVSNFVLP